MPGSDGGARLEDEATASLAVSAELAAELGAEETVSVPVDDALAEELGAEPERATPVDPLPRASFPPAPAALPETALVAYLPRARHDEATSRLLATELPDDAPGEEALPPEEPIAVQAPVAAAQPAAVARPSVARLAGRAVVALAMALGVFVIGHHLVTAADRRPIGPLRVADRAADGVEAEAPAALAPDPADATRPLPELEREAAAHLAAGRLLAAGRIYATLALRAPHEPAYAVAARVLGEGAR